MCRGEFKRVNNYIDYFQVQDKRITNLLLTPLCICKWVKKLTPPFIYDLCVLTFNHRVPRIGPPHPQHMKQWPTHQICVPLGLESGVLQAYVYVFRPKKKKKKKKAYVYVKCFINHVKMVNSFTLFLSKTFTIMLF